MHTDGPRGVQGGRLDGGWLSPLESRSGDVLKTSSCEQSLWGSEELTPPRAPSPPPSPTTTPTTSPPSPPQSGCSWPCPARPWEQPCTSCSWWSCQRWPVDISPAYPLSSFATRYPAGKVLERGLFQSNATKMIYLLFTPTPPSLTYEIFTPICVKNRFLLLTVTDCILLFLAEIETLRQDQDDFL